MNEHVTTLDAENYLRQLKAEIPPHYRAIFQTWFDQGSVYSTVLKGWKNYFEAHKVSPSCRALIFALIADGDPCEGGFISAENPSGPARVREMLGVSVTASKQVCNFIRSCELISPCPNLPQRLRLYGQVEDVPKGDVQGQFSYPDSTPNATASGGGTQQPPGAFAPGGLSFGGAFAPDRGANAPTQGAEAPDENPNMGAKAPDLPEFPPKSGAFAPPYVGKYVGNKSIPTSKPDSSELSRKAAAKADWLGLADLDEVQPEVYRKLTAVAVYAYRREALARCSEVTVEFIEQVEGKLGKTQLGRISHRLRKKLETLRAKRSLAESSPSAAVAHADPVQRAAETERLLVEAREIMAGAKRGGI